MADTEHKMLYDGNRLHTWTETTPDSFDKFMNKAGKTLSFVNAGLDIYDTYQGIGQKKDLNEARIGQANATSDYYESRATAIDNEQSFFDQGSGYDYNPRANPDSNETLTEREGVSNRQKMFNSEQAIGGANLALKQQQLANAQQTNKANALDLFYKQTVDNVLKKTFPKTLLMKQAGASDKDIAQYLSSAGKMKWVAGQNEQGSFLATTDLNGNKITIPTNTIDQVKAGLGSPGVLSKMVQAEASNIAAQLKPDQQFEILQKKKEQLLEQAKQEFPQGIRDVLDNPDVSEAEKMRAKNYYDQLKNLDVISQRLIKEHFPAEETPQGGQGGQKGSVDLNQFDGENQDKNKNKGDVSLPAIEKQQTQQDYTALSGQVSRKASIQDNSENSMWGRSQSDYLPEQPKETALQGQSQPSQAIEAIQKKTQVIQQIAKETGGKLTPSGEIVLPDIPTQKLNALMVSLDQSGVKFHLNGRKLKIL